MFRPRLQAHPAAAVDRSSVDESHVQGNSVGIEGPGMPSWVGGSPKCAANNRGLKRKDRGVRDNEASALGTSPNSDSAGERSHHARTPDDGCTNHIPRHVGEMVTAERKAIEQRLHLSIVADRRLAREHLDHQSARESKLGLLLAGRAAAAATRAEVLRHPVDNAVQDLPRIINESEGQQFLEWGHKRLQIKSLAANFAEQYFPSGRTQPQDRITQMMWIQVLRRGARSAREGEREVQQQAILVHGKLDLRFDEVMAEEEVA
ncbi:hypothetical protein FB451DRAFT_1369339, partial [Mycena latifolia]